MKQVRPVLALLLVIFAGAHAWAQEPGKSAAGPLGGTILRYSGHEAISAPFEYEIDVAATNLTLNLLSQVGDHVSFALARGWTVHGMIESIELTGSTAADAAYRVRLVPTLARLKNSTNSRLFFDMTSQDIITRLLQEHGVAAVEFRLTRSPRRREVIMQYQETDLAFLSRLAEEDGIHYHFEQAPTGHRLVFADSNTGFPPVSRLTFSAETTPAVQVFQRGQALHPGRVQVGDYNWLTPQSPALFTAADSGVFPAETERLHPGLVTNGPESQARANDRLAARVAHAQRCEGTASYTGLRAGHRYQLAGHFREDFNKEYILTAVDYVQSGRGTRATFRCAPSEFVYRPAPLTPRPVIAGALPAIVVAPPGESVHVDQFGRVRVRFPWRDGNTSTDVMGDSGWVKVAQIAAGRGVTSQWLPHAGDEVLVAFEHGDPNRPVVIGSLYNATDMPPTSLPDEKDRTVVFRVRDSNQQLSGELTVDNRANVESILLGGKKDLILQAGEDFTVEALKTSLRGVQNVQVSADGALMLQGAADVKVSSGVDLGVNVGRNLAITGGVDLAVKGGRNLVIEASTLTLRAGGHTIVIDAQGIRSSAPINAPPPVRSQAPPIKSPAPIKSP